MNRGNWWSGCGVGAASELCGVRCVSQRALTGRVILRAVHENRNPDLLWAISIRGAAPSRRSLPVSSTARATFLHFAINLRPPIPPRPRSAALAPSRRPSISALINLPSRRGPHSRRWTSQLFLSPLTTPSIAPLVTPLPRGAPSINHAPNSRSASLDLSLPSAHPLKTLISISCLHSVS